MSPSPEAVNHPRATGATLLLLCACFLLSGIAALIYQTAWTRQFAIVFGTSELAVATVLAAYMGGLALGAWLAERFLPRVTRPVLTYALLELGIALGRDVRGSVSPVAGEHGAGRDCSAGRPRRPTAITPAPLSSIW